LFSGDREELRDLIRMNHQVALDVQLFRSGEDVHRREDGDDEEQSTCCFHTIHPSIFSAT
jgi:hypothetical protein